MIDADIFKRIRTLKDIELEKAKLKYKMLVAERDIMVALRSAGVAFSISNAIARIDRITSMIRSAAAFTGNLFRKLFGRKQNQSSIS